MPHRDNGTHYEGHQRAAEMHDQAAHAHRAAGAFLDKQDHQTGHERSAQALEHSRQAFLHAQYVHEDGIGALAYQLWQARGCPEGSPEADWHSAVGQLRLQK